MAVIAAFGREDSIAATVDAVRGLDGVDDVVVVDDGSLDHTGARAAAAGARLVTLEVNQGKGAAVRAGIEAAPTAAAYLLIDADVGSSAAGAQPLLDAVARGEADLAVGVLPAAGGGGLGSVRRLAAAGIERAAGWRPRAPLSGQRAVRGDLLRSLDLADRFGIETAMTIDASRAGARVTEIDVDMTHRATGRSFAGFRHRGGQGRDILRALWPRITTSRQRIALIVAAFVLLGAAMLWSASRSDPATRPLTLPPRVVLVGIPGLSWDDLGHGMTPHLDGLLATGSAAAMSVRTASKLPSTQEAYASLGASARVRAPQTAADTVAVRRASENLHLPSQAGSLGSALAAAGRRSAALGDTAALALMDRDGHLPAGGVDGADVVLLDTGALARGPGRGDDLRRADDLVGRTLSGQGTGALVLVFSPVPPDREWRLAPVIAGEPGRRGGTLFSPSTRRRGLVTITDLAPTVLEALEVPVPTGMIGHGLRVDPRPVDVGQLRRLDRDAAYREAIYLPVTIWYIAFQAIAYLLAIVALTTFGGSGAAAAAARWLVLAIAAFPLATFVLRAVPGAARLGWGGAALLAAVDLLIAAVAHRTRGHPLTPLQVILTATIALLILDVGTGARLQMSSILGYSPHTAARFRGIGNTAFATLAASTVLFGAIHVQYARRRREALLSVALLFGLVVVVDGAPMLGSDVGGILTMVPVLGLTLVALAGRRITWAIVAAALALTVVAVVGATAVDSLRSSSQQTHLARLAHDVDAQGSSPLTTTIQRKVRTNFRTLSSPWTWAVGVVTVYLALMLAWSRRRSRVLPSAPALRAGALGALAAGLVGYVTNDSGIVVTALVFVYLGPFLTLAALDRSGRPHLASA